ncbi:MAG TPA: hypothetical protein VI233_13085, partial [Puia sp.]
IVKLVNAGDGEVRPVISLVGGKKKSGKGTMMVLTGGLEDVNSLDAPKAVSPVENEILLQGNKMPTVLAAHSMAVIRIKI